MPVDVIWIRVPGQCDIFFEGKCRNRGAVEPTSFAVVCMDAVEAWRRAYEFADKNGIWDLATSPRYNEPRDWATVFGKRENDMTGAIADASSGRLIRFDGYTFCGSYTVARSFVLACVDDEDAWRKAGRYAADHRIYDVHAVGLNNRMADWMAVFGRPSDEADMRFLDGIHHSRHKSALQRALDDARFKARG